jgi:AraC-like DNA-binding protein
MVSNVHWMGGTIDRHDGRWRRALDHDGVVVMDACAMHAVQPDYRIERRTLSVHICNLIVDGSLIVEAAGRRQSVAAGGALWICPGVEHSLRLPDDRTPFTMLNLRFSVQAGERLPTFAAGVLVVDDAWDLRPLWELLIDDRHLRRGDAAGRCRHVLALLYGDLAVRDARAGISGGLGRHRRQVLAAWLRDHLHQRPAPADLAAVLGLSTDWFRRAFQRTFGCSPQAWIVRERVHRAAQRLADDPGLTIEVLAASLGYADHRLFDRQFRAVMGCSPSAWRRR